MDEIGTTGYHGTLVINFKKGINGNYYDKQMVPETQTKDIHIAPSKESAYLWAKMTAQEVLGPKSDYRDDIYILWGQKVSESSLGVDMVFRVLGRVNEELITENITNQIFA